MEIPNCDLERGSTSEELRLLSLAVNETDRAVVVLDQDKRVAYINRVFTEMFGYTVEEVHGKRPMEFLVGPNSDATSLQGRRDRAWNNGGVREETSFYRKDGREIWVSSSSNLVLDDVGQLRNLVVILADISEAKHIQTLQRAVLEEVANGLPLVEVGDLLCARVEKIAPEVICSILLVDSDNRLQSLASPSLPKTYSASLNGAAIGPDVGSCGTAAYLGEDVCVVDIATDPRWENYKSQALSIGLRACWSSPIKMRNGRVIGAFAFYYRENREPSPLHKELVSVCLHLCSLAIERDEAKQQIERLSRYDSLTGLPNRNCLYEMTNDLLCKNGVHEVAFFALDVDRFKDVNSTLGHLAGELILIETASRLRKLVPPLGIVSRTAGDSFVAVVPNCDVTRAALLAAKILQTLKEPIDMPEMVLSISVSIGINVTDETRVAPQVLIEQAVSALHEAKLAGRGMYHFYRSEMNQLAQDRLILGAALRKAISFGSFQLQYQPQLRLGIPEVIGVEALLRWQDESLGDIPPEQFIPLAEEIGQIEAIGCWSLREACRQLSVWKQNRIPIPAISVNLSPSHFRSPDLSGYVAGLLKEYALAPRCLTIEITEDVMMDSGSQALETLTRLHRIGVGLSIDDFGTGFSSLARLIRLPITELKLDRSFMRNFETDTAAQAVATAVIRIGQSLNMTVIAEGVENEMQARLLFSYGCDAVQGYLYGKPMSAQALESWIAAPVPGVGSDLLRIFNKV